jgi:hypothetical protein
MNALHPHELAVRLDSTSRTKLTNLTNPVFYVSVLFPHSRSGNYQPPLLPDCIEGELKWEVDFIKKGRVLASVCKILSYFI